MATVTPTAAHAATPYIWIDRIDGKYVVQGRNFPANAKGTIWAQMGDISGQKDVHTEGNGYFWVTFYRFTTEHNGASQAKVWIKGVEATASKDMTKYTGGAWKPSGGTSEASGGATAGTTTTTAKPASTTTTPSAAPSAGAPSTSGWVQTFADDFNGSSLSNKWGVYEGKGNQGIGRRVASAVSVSNGELRIKGSGWDGGGVAANLDQTYGRYDVRFRIDRGHGYNTAILLWPTSERWPVDGEIDISETFNGDVSKSGSFIHYGSSNSQLYHIENGDFSQWHTYSVDWQPGSITYHLDGRKVWTVTQSSAIPHNKHFLALQLDVASDSNKTSQTLHVDSVKVYKKA